MDIPKKDKVTLIFSILFFIFVIYATLQGWKHEASILLILVNVYWFMYFSIKSIKYIKMKEKYRIISCILLSISILVVLIGQLFSTFLL